MEFRGQTLLIWGSRVGIGILQKNGANLGGGGCRSGAGLHECLQVLEQERLKSLQQVTCGQESGGLNGTQAAWEAPGVDAGRREVSSGEMKVTTVSIFMPYNQSLGEIASP